jgi:hypothetical protein
LDGRSAASAERVRRAGIAAVEAFAKADCNAIAPETSRAIGATIGRRLRYIDAGIVGGPPREGYDGPRIHACGAHVVPLEGEIGTASAFALAEGSR